jgi:hypothetical protein
MTLMDVTLDAKDGYSLVPAKGMFSMFLVDERACLYVRTSSCAHRNCAMYQPHYMHWNAALFLSFSFESACNVS